jgi:cell division protein FtsI/penicillin-binding protein 2
MLRRHFLPTLFAATAARAEDRLATCFGDAHGTAILLNAATRRLVAVHAPDLAGRLLAPPGSTVKPFVIAALLECGKLRPDESYRCPGALRIGGYNMACSHPPGLPPMQARTAIAYSCNCFVARYAARFEPAELANVFARSGLLSGTEGVLGELTRADVRLQALGESGIRVTPAALAMAYARRAWTGSVLGGLEDAVEFGTAQRARVAGIKVAGKTGSVRAPDGMHVAWFAGFTSRYAVTVMLQGRSGGADAAPIAARILEAAHAIQ